MKTFIGKNKGKTYNLPAVYIHTRLGSQAPTPTHTHTHTQTNTQTNAKTNFHVLDSLYAHIFGLDFGPYF